jgi:hypothetical protein
MSSRAEFLRAAYVDRRRRPQYDGALIMLGRGLVLIAILSVVAWWVL